MPDVSAETIVRVPASRLPEAVAQVMAKGVEAGAAERFMAFLQCQGHATDLCWAVEAEGGRLGPVYLAIPNVGRTAMIFVTPPRAAADVPRLVRLIDEAHGRLNPARVALAQALLEPNESLLARAFVQAGYTRLAVLHYMERRLTRLRSFPEPQWPDEVTLLPYRPALEGQFKQALAASYVETLDCPALCGLRDLDDVLRDHKGAGIQDPTLWTLVLWEGQPAAVLLLNPLADGESVELSYLGVGSEHRRRGLGRRLMARAMHQLSERPFRRFTLAVDERNEPALNLYRSFGLASTDRRLAYIRPVADVRGS